MCCFLELSPLSFVGDVIERLFDMNEIIFVMIRIMFI